MSQFFNQIVNVRIGNKEYSNKIIDIDFDVEFDNNPEPDVHEISLWNTSADTKANIKKGTEVILSVGYGEDIGTIVTGTIGSYEVIHYDVDNELKLFVGDGISVWDKKVSKSYKAGISAMAVAKDLLGIFGLEVGKLSLKDNITYAKGISFNSGLSSALKRVAKDTNSRFYIKNNLAYMVSDDFNVTTGFLLNKDTGLIGTPERIDIDKKEGWRIKCLLNHRLNVGSRLQVASRSLNGNVKVVKGKHSSDFITELEVLAI